MAHIVNITDKLTNEKPKIQIGEKQYEVNSDMKTVFKFEELAENSTLESTIEAISLSLGGKAAKELKIDKMSTKNFKTIMIAIMAAMQEISFEEASSRFQG